MPNTSRNWHIGGSRGWRKCSRGQINLVDWIESWKVKLVLWSRVLLHKNKYWKDTAWIFHSNNRSPEAWREKGLSEYRVVPHSGRVGLYVLYMSYSFLVFLQRDIPSSIYTIYETMNGVEPTEVPSMIFIQQCHTILQVVGETITAWKLEDADSWH